MRGIPVRWLKIMIKRLRGEPEPELETRRPRPTAADRALAREDQKLEKVHGETSEIMEAAATLKRLGERNDFAARIRHSLGG